MMMKRFVTMATLTMFLGFLPLVLHAQDWGAPNEMKGKFVIGGQVGAGFSGGGFHFGISPQLGYRPVRSLEVGVRIGYDLDYYYRTYYGGSLFYHYFAGAVYANYEIYRGIYVHVEDEEMCCLVRGSAVNPSVPQWYNTVFAGGGYRQYIGTSYMYYALLFNMTGIFEGYYSTPYASPYIIRMGYCWSL